MKDLSKEISSFTEVWGLKMFPKPLNVYIIEISHS